MIPLSGRGRPIREEGEGSERGRDGSPVGGTARRGDPGETSGGGAPLPIAGRAPSGGESREASKRCHQTVSAPVGAFREAVLPQAAENAAALAADGRFAAKGRSSWEPKNAAVKAEVVMSCQPELYKFNVLVVLVGQVIPLTVN